MHKLVQLAVTISVASASQDFVASDGKIIRSESNVGDGDNKEGTLSLKEFKHSLQDHGSNEDDDDHGFAFDEEHRDVSKVAEEDQDGNDDAQDSENGDNTNDEDDDDMTQRDDEVDTDLDSTKNAQNSENDMASHVHGHDHDNSNHGDDDDDDADPDLPVDDAASQKLLQETALDDADDST